MADFESFLKDITDFAVTLHANNTTRDEYEEFLYRKENELLALTNPELAFKVKKERITNVRKSPNDEEFKENGVESKKSFNTSHSTQYKTLQDVQNDLNIKVEKVKEEKLTDSSLTSMPPPKQPARKLRTKKVSSAKVRSERESDVIIQSPHVSIISLCDGDDEQEVPTRNTRTKTRAMAKKKKNMEEVGEPDSLKTKTIEEKSKICNETYSKQELSVNITNGNVKSDDVEKMPVRSTRTKTRAIAASTMKKDQPDVNNRILEDTNENNQKKTIETNTIVNETYIKTPTKPLSIANETVVIPKEQRMVVTTPLNKQVPIEDLLTDDEDDGVHIKLKTINTKKPIFSQYEISPVKKRVEAFEKLGAEIAADRRTTTNKNKLKGNSSSAVKSKQITPLKSGIPTYKNGFSSSSKIRSASKSILKNVLAPKTVGALKTSQQEYIEREARRREKEQEALRKKEALLQAKQEEIKRKNEEKQLKLAHLKAKQEAEEMERIKEQQRQEKINKNNHKMQPPQKKKERPRYMDVTAPLLPLDDCFDSDDEQGRVTNVERPSWTRSRFLRPSVMRITFAQMDITNTFFMRKATTPNLEDLFGPMNSQKLKRTSSAVWTKPPRFTLMPIPQLHEEDEEED